MAGRKLVLLKRTLREGLMENAFELSFGRTGKILMDRDLSEVYFR